MSKRKTFDPEAIIGGEVPEPATPEAPEPTDADLATCFAQAHRAGYRRGGRTFTGAVEPFLGEPTDEQKADPYIKWWNNDNGEAGTVIAREHWPTLKDHDVTRRKADEEMRRKIDAQNKHGDSY